MTLRARLLVGLLVLAAAGLAVAGGVTYQEQKGFLLDRVDAQLRSAGPGGPLARPTCDQEHHSLGRADRRQRLHMQRDRSGSRPRAIERHVDLRADEPWSRSAGGRSRVRPRGRVEDGRHPYAPAREEARQAQCATRPACGAPAGEHSGGAVRRYRRLGTGVCRAGVPSARGDAGGQRGGSEKGEDALRRSPNACLAQFTASLAGRTAAYRCRVAGRRRGVDRPRSELDLCRSVARQV